MYTVIVKYGVAEPRSRAEMLDGFLAAGKGFQGPKGLIRKYFCYDEAAHTGHSVYLWEGRADADAFFGERFAQVMQEKFGATPEWFGIDTLLVVDNEHGTMTQG